MQGMERWRGKWDPCLEATRGGGGVSAMLLSVKCHHFTLFVPAGDTVEDSGAAYRVMLSN